MRAVSHDASPAASPSRTRPRSSPRGLDRSRARSSAGAASVDVNYRGARTNAPQPHEGQPNCQVVALMQPRLRPRCGFDRMTREDST